MVSLEAFNHETTSQEVSEAEPAVLSLQQAGSIIETLSSTTGRAIMALVTDEPRNPAAIADELDMSVQNAIYHLERLEECGLVEVVGTRYSCRGHEMDVYAPATGAIVIEVGDQVDPAGQLIPAEPHDEPAEPAEPSTDDDSTPVIEPPEWSPL